MKKWILAWMIFSVGMGLIFSFACTRRGRKHSPDTLIIGIARDWSAGDIWLHRGENCLIFETLIRQNKEGGYIPFIAESWEKSEDGQDYTFRIKKGITFSDGTRVTAYHIKESFIYIEKSKEMVKTASGHPGHYQSPGQNKEVGNKGVGNEGVGNKEGDDKGGVDTVAYNLPRWSALSSVDVLDEYTIRFHLEQPYNLLLDELATTHMSPILKPSPDEKTPGFIGTGPYIATEWGKEKERAKKECHLASYISNLSPFRGTAGNGRDGAATTSIEQKGDKETGGLGDREARGHFPLPPSPPLPLPPSQYLLLVKNPHYWQGEVKVPRIYLKVIPDPKTRVIALKAGDIDLTGIDSADQIPLDMIPQLKASHLSVEKISSLDPAVHALALNYQKEPFTDINVRKAIAMTISQNKINDLIHDAALSIDGPVPQNSALYNPLIRRRRNNVSGARQMLAEAGWTGRSADGTIMKDGKRFSVTLFCNCFDPVYKAIAEEIKIQLQEVGIAVHVQYTELSKQIERMRNKTFEMALWPQMRYPMFYYTKCPSWLSVYQSPELDDAFSVFLYSNDPVESQQAFYTTQELITESCVQPFFFEIFNVVAWNNTRLLEFEPLSVGWNLGMDLWKARLSQSI